jgi:tetratricopeptide (TPR) repeat protein
MRGSCDDEVVHPDPVEPGADSVGSGSGGETQYDWFRRAEGLLAQGNPEAAAIILQRLHDADPTSASVLEAWARALFDARRYEEAAEAFGALVERSPDDDYAHYGLGLSLWRLQRFPSARDHLAMARVMRPGRPEYEQAHQQVMATLRARAEAGLPAEGPVAT